MRGRLIAPISSTWRFGCSETSAAPKTWSKKRSLACFEPAPNDIEDQKGWLIVVTSRLCLDHMRSACARRERAADRAVFDEHALTPTSADPADRITLDDDVRLALLVVLEHLSPSERVVFVLHDIFQTPFATIALTVGRTPASCRQLARRARRKVADAGYETPRGITAARHQHVTEKFMAACSNGNINELVSVLDPDVDGDIDIRDGLVVSGAERVARNLIFHWGKPNVTLTTQPVGDDLSLLAFVDRTLAAVLVLTFHDDRIKEIHVIASRSRLDLLRAQLAVKGSLRATSSGAHV